MLLLRGPCSHVPPYVWASLISSTNSYQMALTKRFLHQYILQSRKLERTPYQALVLSYTLPKAPATLVHSDLELHLYPPYLTNPYRSPITHPKLKILRRRYRYGRTTATNLTIDVLYADPTVILVGFSKTAGHDTRIYLCAGKNTAGSRWCQCRLTRLSHCLLLASETQASI